jgi:hypothetical protein
MYAQVTKLFIMQFSPSSCHFILFGPNIFLSFLFSYLLSLCSSFNVGVQLSHQYKTTGIIISFFILIFTFEAVDKKAKGSGLNASKHYANANVRNIGQGEPRHRKYKRLKLGGGQTYDRSSD